ncbi:YgiT-type zinc finger protein [Desulfonatronospira sp.]|uniref:YgiT-type zinc finger protein n=1 Tax=Desulfonatronospira sp. TaxID=1962951 RepID=UPI0025C2BBA5|nr:YgiT-type zinc finger protein [Desulfonatronospira sp.]
MKCFECGGEVLKTLGAVKMACPDGGFIVFKDIPMNQCRQCGEQYIPGKWAEKIGFMMRNRESLTPSEIIQVPVVTPASDACA